MAKVAVPLLRVTGLPTFVPSTLNCTVPVGRAVPAVGATVAVKVTDCMNADGFTELATVVVVLSALTVWLVEPVLVVKLPVSGV
jgi:hypothetical protein